MIKGVKSAGPVHGCWWLGKRWDDEMEKHMHDGHKLGGVGVLGLLHHTTHVFAGDFHAGQDEPRVVYPRPIMPYPHFSLLIFPYHIHNQPD